MRHILAMAVLGGMLVLGGSAAFASDNTDPSFPAQTVATPTTMQDHSASMVQIGNQIAPAYPPSTSQNR